jgi:hypothetical protein
MFKLIVAFLIVVAVALSSLIAFRRSSRLGQPSQDVIDRVKIREREIVAKQRADGDD